MRSLTTILIALLVLIGTSSYAQDSEVQKLITKANEQMDAGKKQLAKSTIEKAYELEPKNTEVLSLKGFIHYELDEYESAVTTYNELIALDATSGEAFYYRGMAHVDLKNMDKACEDFTKAKELGYKLARIQYQQFCM